MSTAILMCVLFFAKVVDNALSTTKTILVQRNHSILAGIALAASNFIYLCITKNVVNSDSYLALIVVSLASGVGCCMAVAVSSRLSKEKTYVNVIMSDDKEKMQAFRDFLAQHHITNTATDSYTLDWTTKSITVTAFAETNVHIPNVLDDLIETSKIICNASWSDIKDAAAFFENQVYSFSSTGQTFGIARRDMSQRLDRLIKAYARMQKSSQRRSLQFF